MVKKLDLQTYLEGCSAQRFFDKVYAGAEPMKKWHQMVNKDPAVEVTPWDEGVRTVSFVMPLAFPDFIKSMVGVESVKVQERQAVVWQSATQFSVTSATLVMNIPGGNRFITSLLLTVSEDGQHASAAAAAAAAAAVSAGNGSAGEANSVPAGATQPTATGVSLRFSVTCSAGLPWPVSVSIENVMIDKAQLSMSGYLDFCCRLVDESLAAPGPMPLQRWPTAIACSTAFDAGDLEAPLLGEGGSPNEDDFYSPQGSISGTGTPARRRGTSLNKADFQSLLEAHGSAPSAVRRAPAGQDALTASTRPMTSNEMQQVMVVLHSMQGSLQRLEANVNILNTKHDLEATAREASGKWSCSGATMVLLMLLAAFGVFYLSFWHRTGLLPVPPSAASPPVLFSSGS